MVLRYVEASRFGSGPCVGITAVAFSTHGKFLAAAALDGKLRIWSVETGQLLYVFSSTVPMLSLTWAGTDEDTVLCGLQDGTISCLFATPVRPSTLLPAILSVLMGSRSIFTLWASGLILTQWNTWRLRTVY